MDLKIWDVTLCASDVEGAHRWYWYVRVKIYNFSISGCLYEYLHAFK